MSLERGWYANRGEGMSLEWQDIARFGKKVVQAGLTSSRFGNISLRRGDKIFITCTGSMLDELDEAQIVKVNLVGPCPKEASSETCVHRAVYQRTSFSAIIHTHSPYAVAMSLIESDKVQPIDSEGLHFLGDMPVVEGSFGSDDLAEMVSSAIQTHKACVARGHGVFAAGGNLADAYTTAAMAEHSSHIRYLVKAYETGRNCP